MLAKFDLSVDAGISLLLLKRVCLRENGFLFRIAHVTDKHCEQTLLKRSKLEQ